MVNLKPGRLVQVLSFLSFFSSINGSPDPNLVHLLGAQGVNLWKLEKAQAAKDVARAAAEFEPRWFVQPLDHFDKKSTRTFKQRYWVNDRHYVAGTGGPVIVLDGGETSGEDRIPFLDTGIVEILAKATGGVGVVLEHRYYGASIAVNNLTTDNLRWLTNEQAAADSANFMANVKFEGINENLTSPKTPWIYYGGSYAGARAAHMKILYPELTYGSIASSGVTHAELSNWGYMEIIRRGANQTCSVNLQKSIVEIDNILDNPSRGKQLKALFGLQDLKHDDDFVSLIQSPLGAWQSRVWDPAVGSTSFDRFCAAINAPATNTSTSTGDLKISVATANYGKYIKNNIASRCPKDQTIEQCFGTYDDTQYQKTTLDQDWRLWQFQVCTQWGYFTTAPPDPKHPRIISRRLTLDYLSKICKQAYLPGQFIKVPRFPNITAVNALGDFDIAADRLAIIDGEVDPWRPDTPHSDRARNRRDTMLRPFKLIPGAVHHWDEWGLPNIEDEPPEIRKIHGEMILFVMEWLKDFKPPRE